MKRSDEESESENYTVGYKKPPEHTKFMKGESGNKKGRPKGTKNLKTETIEELTETIKMRFGDRSVRISKHRALLKILMLKATKGDVRAIKTLLDFVVQVFGIEGMPVGPEIRLTAAERTALDLFEKQFEKTSAAEEPPAVGGVEESSHE